MLMTHPQKQAALIQLFDAFGYGPDFRRSEYPVWTGRQVFTVALAGFGTADAFDMTTATMVGFIPNGRTMADGLEAARALAAPLAVVAKEQDVELWTIAAAPRDTKVISSAAYADLANLTTRFRDSLGRVELWQSKRTGQQLSLFPLDVRLLAHARRTTSQSLAGLVEQAMAIGMATADSDDVTRLRDHLLEVSRVVVGVMAALMLKDKAGESRDRSDTVLQDAAAIHPRYFTWMDSLSPRLTNAVPDILSFLANQANFASLDASSVGRVYEDAITTSEIRRRYGIFYTPPALAERIVSAIPFEALPPDQRTVYDPACGSGTLLLASHGRLTSLLPSARRSSLDYLRRMLSGADQDSLAVDLARLALLLTAAGDGWRVEHQELRPDAPLTGDSRPHVIVSNPPWLYRRTPAAGREQLADAFVHWSLDSVAPGGFVAFVLPSSWLSTVTSGPARDDFLQRASVFEVWRLTEEVFTASDVAPCVVIAQAGTSRRHFVFRRVLKRDGALQRFFSTGVADENILAELTDAQESLLRGPLDELEGRNLPRLKDVALVRSGVVPEPGRRMGRSIGNAWWLSRAGHMDAYQEIPREALLRVRYPEDFHHASVRAQEPFLKPKLLVSAKRSPDNPWRLTVAVDTEGDVIPRESIYQVVPLSADELYALLAVFASSVATAYIDTYGTKMAYGRPLLEALPVPRRGGAWAQMRNSGQAIARQANDVPSLQRALRRNEVVVRHAYGLSRNAAGGLDRLLAGFSAPEGVVRYAQSDLNVVRSPSGPRLFVAC